MSVNSSDSALQLSNTHESWFSLQAHDQKFRGMEVAVVIETVLSKLLSEDILACLVGEIALNYYNVPRVMHVSALSFPVKNVALLFSGY